MDEIMTPDLSSKPEEFRIISVLLLKEIRLVLERGMANMHVIDAVSAQFYDQLENTVKKIDEHL